MKKIFLLSFFVTIILLSASALAIEVPGINIALMNQIPDPVGPGKYVELRFSVFNSMPGTVAEDFQIELIPEYPFSIDKSEVSLRSLGNLPAMGSGSNVFVVKYKVRVAQDVIHGDVPIKLRYKHNNMDWITRQFDISVQTLDANLAIVSVSSNPEKIKPGDETEVKVMVRNMADSILKDVTLKIDLTYSDIIDSLVTTTATDKLMAFNILPFAPIGSATEQKIYSLKPGEEHEFVYKIITYSDAESRIYKIPVEITYFDELGTEYIKKDIMGLIVGTKPDLSYIVDQSELYVGNRLGTVTIRFINKGFSDVKFLDVKMECTDDFEVLSAKEVYVGNVDSDDYETVDFKLYLKNGVSKEERTIVLPVKVEYRDTNNNLYHEDLELEMRVLSSEKLGMKKSNFGIIIFIFLVFSLIGIFLYRRSKNKKKK
jgi:hypothetical protein